MIKEDFRFVLSNNRLFVNLSAFFIGYLYILSKLDGFLDISILAILLFVFYNFAYEYFIAQLKEIIGEKKLNKIMKK